MNRRFEVVVLAIGLTLAGWFIGHGFVSGRTADRFVTVKGVAERDVVADLALWPLQIVAGADDLGSAQAIIDRSAASVMDFLVRHDVDTSQVELQGVEVTDRASNQFADQGWSGFRYVVQQRLMVRSDDPLPIHAASLGGVESLIIIPAKSSHLGMTLQDRARVGISDGLVRFSTGIESADDLIDDLQQALDG